MVIKTLIVQRAMFDVHLDEINWDTIPIILESAFSFVSRKLVETMETLKPQSMVYFVVFTCVEPVTTTFSLLMGVSSETTLSVMVAPKTFWSGKPAHFCC